MNPPLLLDNLYNTPFLMQVGERDGAYDRNHVTAENHINLNNLQLKYHGGYIHDIFIHYNGSHNSWHDNDDNRNPQTIIAKPIEWLHNNNREKALENTNAIDWMNAHTRNPFPEKLVWDLSVGAEDRTYQTGRSIAKNHDDVLAQPRSLFYWLDVSVAGAYPEHGKLVVQALKATNTIKILEVKDIEKFRILLNPKLLDLDMPINVEVGAKLIAKVKVKENLETMVRTVFERSDPNQIYDAEMTLAYNKQTHRWEVSDQQ